MTNLSPEVVTYKTSAPFKDTVTEQKIQPWENSSLLEIMTVFKQNIYESLLSKIHFMQNAKLNMQYMLFVFKGKMQYIHKT